MVVNINAHIIGLNPSTSPIATPAKAEWAKVSPIMECLLSTKNTPTIGHNMDMNMAAKKAFCINSY